MKVRVGYGLGNLRPLDGERLGALAEGLEQHGFDSLWLSERISGPAPDPVLGLTWAAARTQQDQARHERAGAPGPEPRARREGVGDARRRSPADARCPAFGLGIAHPVEQQAFGVARGDRASIFDEALPLIRRLWSEDSVDHDGTWFHYEGMHVLPKPDEAAWTCGSAARRRRSCAASAGSATAGSRRSRRPTQCAAARPVIEDAADAADRAIDPEHFGVMVFYTHEELPEQLVQVLASRNPDVDPNDARRARLARGARAVRALRRRRVLEAGARPLRRAQGLGRRARGRCRRGPADPDLSTPRRRYM